MHYWMEDCHNVDSNSDIHQQKSINMGSFVKGMKMEVNKIYIFYIIIAKL